jgi:hypothetical protein
MGIELVIDKELANIGMTLTEFASITEIINGEIGPGDFSNLFNTMMGRMTKSYDVVIDNLQPFIDLDSEEDFIAGFDDLVTRFKESYLLEISKSRTLTVDAYDDYEHLVCMREAKTKFPLLKRTFTRLAELTDKWIANDYWLAMSIDTAYKMLPRLLTEIAEIKEKDPSDAFLIYRAAFSDFSVHLGLIKQENARFFASLRQPEEAAAAL